MESNKRLAVYLTKVVNSIRPSDFNNIEVLKKKRFQTFEKMKEESFGYISNVIQMYSNKEISYIRNNLKRYENDYYSFLVFCMSISPPSIKKEWEIIDENENIIIKKEVIKSLWHANELKEGLEKHGKCAFVVEAGKRNIKKVNRTKKLLNPLQFNFNI